jgi:hypothetical protein
MTGLVTEYTIGSCGACLVQIAVVQLGYPENNSYDDTSSHHYSKEHLSTSWRFSRMTCDLLNSAMFAFCSHL